MMKFKEIKRTNHFRTASAALEYYDDVNDFTFFVGAPEVGPGESVFVGAGGMYFILSK
jgi:hypothetical protein